MIMRALQYTVNKNKNSTSELNLITYYREEKPLRHIVMVTKFLDDNKPKTSLKKWICTISNFMDIILFHFIC